MTEYPSPKKLSLPPQQHPQHHTHTHDWIFQNGPPASDATRDRNFSAYKFSSFKISSIKFLQQKILEFQKKVREKKFKKVRKRPYATP
jgi:hypothetical protein